MDRMEISRRTFVGATGTLAAGALLALAGCSGATGGSPSGTQRAASASTFAYDIDSRQTVLANGVAMPIFGIGTYALTPDEAAESVYWAIEAGARLIDTAAAYNNEEGVGRGIARALSDGLVTREKLFVTTKLWQDGYSEKGVDGALKRLDLDYVDLLFVHQAMGDYTVGYETVIKAQEAGKTRCIGLSNFSNSQFVSTVDLLGVVPQVAQYETHLHLQRHAAQGFLAQYGTQLEGWFPLGGKGNTQAFLNDGTVNAIAQSHGKSAAQVIERWHLQEGRVIMPGSHNRDHIRENTELFDFSLDATEMEQLRALDQNSAYFGMVGQMDQQTLDEFGNYTFEAR